MIERSADQWGTTPRGPCGCIYDEDFHGRWRASLERYCRRCKMQTRSGLSGVMRRDTATFSRAANQRTGAPSPAWAGSRRGPSGRQRARMGDVDPVRGGCFTAHFSILSTPRVGQSRWTRSMGVEPQDRAGRCSLATRQQAAATDNKNKHPRGEGATCSWRLPRSRLPPSPRRLTPLAPAVSMHSAPLRL
jgi:hypothetical protein